ncbi:type I DNA topoisomerase [Rickettsia endosymbiont of Cardiosporidium cionae]|uniref:type I DNA topoisomerase n=1 Tax=Rickettsia endosymbiont of Cardiosporidium cionae TaxID=2777155 RepID=UPI001895A629|nr:type I DNA topoisomerase [Rickettsia endosymbiont of Cardiosporidium cionae]KAF8818436.1 type I DNA topoisomerase [Rickettsia endosymbiont of Cardiosporidium cionae]
MKLLIVESPSKIKTISKYLDKNFKIAASYGHVRALPSKVGSVLPEQDFSMKYEMIDKSTKHMKEIIQLAKEAKSIYLATDPDREGEAISWHIYEILKEQKEINTNIIKRIVFYEVTKKAVLQAIDNPKDINLELVRAQQARQALDYLVGFTLSPVLWKKLPGCRSAGRVQSVALRIISDREQEIENFVSQEYWDIWGHFKNTKGEAFTSKLISIDDNKLHKFFLSKEEEARTIVKKIKNNSFYVKSLQKKQHKRNPYPPFITASLQQEAVKQLGFSAKKTMQLAQKLYEGIKLSTDIIGLITYMRTDCTILSSDAIQDIRSLILNKYGKEYLPKSPIVHKSKTKNTQEAHEAIRPTDINITPDSIKDYLDKDSWNLYNIIWCRALASQMEKAIINSVIVNISSLDNKFDFKANGSTVEFDGFCKLYREKNTDENTENTNALPTLTENEKLSVDTIKPIQHFTEPAPRYNEASLIKKLEDLGIGRPSTYTNIISVLEIRKYVVKDRKKFFPTSIGRLLNTFLTGFFIQYVEYSFTADLEENLDKISTGTILWKELLKTFWEGFYYNINQVNQLRIQDIIPCIEEKLDKYLFHNNKKSIGDADSVNKNQSHINSRQCPSCSNGTIILKLSKFGPFLSCSNYPECKFTQQIENSAINNDSSDITDNKKLLGKDINDNNIYLKKGPYGWYLELENALDLTKPKKIAIPKTINPNDISLDEAIKILCLPNTIGKYKNTSEDIIINVGRYGPYIKYMSKFFYIPKSINFSTITLENAINIIDNKNLKSKKNE